MERLLRTGLSRGLHPLPPAQLPTVPLGTWWILVQTELVLLSSMLQASHTSGLAPPLCLVPRPPQQGVRVVLHTKHP